MTMVPTIDETIVSRFRTAVGQALAERTAAAERSGGPGLDLDDQMALARRLVNDELERYAHERLGHEEPLVLADCEDDPRVALFPLEEEDDPDEPAWLPEARADVEASTRCRAGTTARTALDAAAGDTNATASNAVSTVVGMSRNFFTRTPPAR